MHKRKLWKLSCVAGESVVKDWATAAVVVAGERASNRGMKNRLIFLQQQRIYLSASHREGDGEKLSHCLHGETLARQPEMFDKAPERRSLNRYAAV